MRRPGVPVLHRALRLLRAAAPPLLLLFAAAACRESGQTKPTVIRMNSREPMPDQESWKSTVMFSDSGRLRAVLVAGHIRMYLEKRETLLDSGLVVDFYNTDGRHSSKLTADRGRVDDATKNIEGFGRVVFVSDSGTVVRTEYLFWDNALRRVRGNQYVTITSARERLQGYGFEADQGLKNYTVYGRIQGQAEVREEGK